MMRSASSSEKGVVTVGLLWVVVLGGTGGPLTYEYGINVRGINPLLP